MSPLNSTVFINSTIVRPEFFIISGFSGLPHSKYYYVFLCFVYALSVLGNAFIMFMIYTDHCLHSPKYIAVFNLAVADLCVSTALVPPLIDTFLFKSQLISYEACLSNMFFVFLFLIMQSFTLTVLSYDRLVAICFPLRYNEIVTNKSMLVITAITWIIAGLAILIAVIFISTLSFCKSVVINSYFCDHGPTFRLACNDNTPNYVISWSHPALIFWLPLLFIICTYISIARALLKIATASERLKALKTCTSHLILVGIYYFPICLTYGAIGSTMHQNARIINTSLGTILPSMLNPIVYSLKTEEFTESIKKLYRKKKIHITVRNK
ncbi:olfactory receptor 1F1-like [Anguilla anguilla]|uniref:olfactory receptor 1F1-like n=1 Tax=Anguilla anguilla TaxID=7936 RepID=UPI0015B009DE|nr:olfactory receptor 1F1-like [Anguilla anguilla]XP_035290437.1 olfactory receptor 1F1-like [Anguilla anguilla]XP_035290438.1 olfactory receptor 1F1-like [Anguilla anguilla]XP_035290439.1 olfactory receptor 1F1-like [Anguilla anguilla]